LSLLVARLETFARVNPAQCWRLARFSLEPDGYNPAIARHVHPQSGFDRRAFCQVFQQLPGCRHKRQADAAAGRAGKFQIIRSFVMEVLLQQIINGLVLGSMYALIALGYTMVYGIINLINFAHGEVLMVGALTSWTIIGLMQSSMPGTPGWLILLISLLIAFVVCGTLNFAIEKIAYRPLRNSPKLAPLITAIGMSLLLQTLAMIIWKPNYKPYPTLLPSEPYEVAGAVITVTQLFILGATVVSLSVLMWLVHYTRLGRAMRATAENPRVAALMGVRPDTVISATFIIGALLAALAGVMYASNYGTVQHAMGFLPGLKAFTAAVFGGIGNLGGAVLGGVLLGLIESIGAGYIGPLTGGVLGSQYSDIFAFIVLIFVLTLRPSGLLGERVADRA
jgi:branched-chain amino acid transport system permease protein